MKDIELKAVCNNLLGSEETLALYMTLYYATKNLTSHEIIDITKNKYGVDIDINRFYYILKSFTEKDIIRKHVKNGAHTYHLHRKIYIPSSNTPIPTYQLFMLVTVFLFVAEAFLFDEEVIFKLSSIVSFSTLIAVVILHQLMFELNPKAYLTEYLLKFKK